MDYYLDSEQIIFEVQKYPCLYDINHEEYKMKELKSEAWTAVAKSVVGDEWEGMDNNTKYSLGKELQKRWKSLKDSYCKSLKNGPGKSKKPYIYTRQLNFLQEVFEPRESQDNNDSADEQVNEVEEIISEVDVGAPGVRTEAVRHEEPTPGSSNGPNVRLPANKRKLDAFEMEIFDILKTNLAQQPLKASSDPDEMFIMSQMPIIKRLKPSDKLQFQIQFIQLLQKFKVDDNAT